MKFVEFFLKPNPKKVVAFEFRLVMLLMLSGFLSIANPNPAKAKMINPFGVNNGATLSKDDYKIALAAVRELLNEKTLKVGAHATWRNSASGNHGKFTILDVFISKGMPCRKINSYVAYQKPGATPRSFTLNVCKLSNGEWKTVA